MSNMMEKLFISMVGVNAGSFQLVVSELSFCVFNNDKKRTDKHRKIKQVAQTWSEMASATLGLNCWQQAKHTDNSSNSLKCTSTLINRTYIR